MVDLNEVAKSFKNLHVPGNPILLANVYDIISAETIAAIPSCKALATASYAVAESIGTQDRLLTLEENLEAVKNIAKVAKKHNKPLTVDLQDGYGDKLEEAIKAVIEAGAVGVNIEDVDKDTGKQYSQAEAAARIARALQAAKEAGMQDFVVNARCDTLLVGGSLEDTICRGKAYLAAGGTTVFVFGGGRAISKEEKIELVKAFGGKLALGYILGGPLTIGELKELGVARLSIGPQLMLRAQGYLRSQATEMLNEA